MNNEMLYAMLSTSLKKMSDEELKTNLEKARGFLSPDDFNKLVKLIEAERNKK